MHYFHKFILSWNSTCFGQSFCPSSGVYSLHTRHWYMSYRFVDSFRVAILVLIESCLQTCMTYINSECTVNKLLMIEELSETCRVSWQNKFVKLVHLVAFVIKKFVTIHGHTNVKNQVKLSYVLDTKHLK